MKLGVANLARFCTGGIQSLSENSFLGPLVRIY